MITRIIRWFVRLQYFSYGDLLLMWGTALVLSWFGWSLVVEPPWLGVLVALTAYPFIGALVFKAGNRRRQREGRGSR